jgi:hypothetical protein
MSRVSSDGNELLVLAHERLTSYDNGGVSELYRYTTSDAALTCVSCNPAGAPPTIAPSLLSIRTTSSPASPASIEPRNMSSDGARVFFETSDSLLARDTNGVQDVYEWEAVGAGSCTNSSEGFSSVSQGCLFLVSSGISPQPTFFGDASADGNNVFLFSSQSLVGQDGDPNVDVYDARVDGGIASQSLAPSSPCEGEECRGAISPAPGFLSPAREQLAGEGNVLTPAEAPAKPASRPLTRKQKLARALHACKRKHGRRRKACEASARRRFGNKRPGKHAGVKNTGRAGRKA